MSGKRDESDQGLEDYLAGKSTLSALYTESKTIIAPDKLTGEIQALARKELAKDRAKRTWFIPLSLAATIMLSLSIYLINNEPTLVETSPPLAEHKAGHDAGEQQAVARSQTAEKAPALADNDKQLIPEHILDLLQPTAKRADTDHEAYPSPAVLKTWAPHQWAKKIHQLQVEKQNRLADKYILDFKKYYPQNDINELLKLLEH